MKLVPLLNETPTVHADSLLRFKNFIIGRPVVLTKYHTLVISSIGTIMEDDGVIFLKDLDLEIYEPHYRTPQQRQYIKLMIERKLSRFVPYFGFDDCMFYISDYRYHFHSEESKV